jgi:hypothetical protein
MASLAERFFTRFAALNRVYGLYILSATAIAHHKAGEKLEGGGRTVHGPPTVELFERHLAGALQLGLVPIRDDSTCCWGAIDIDEYNINHDALEITIRNIGLPLIVCKTKSGGAHLYCFTNEDVPAELMRGKLMEWAVTLGHSGVEVYPKQTRLAGKNDDGNWINVPYSGGADSVRYAIYQGARLGPTAFLDLVDTTFAISEDHLRTISAPRADAIETHFDGCPPCLETLIARGRITELRNQAIFSVIVYLRKVWGDDFKEEMVDQYNQEFFDPPLGHKEISHLIKSTSKKNYNYKCHDEPIRSVCNRQICLTRRFGVGGGTDDPGVEFGQLVKLDTDPPIWLWDVDGARIELSTDELQTQSRFQKKCMEVIHKWPNTIKPKAWQEIVRDRLAKVDIRDVPGDASNSGQMLAHLEAYCTSRAQARNKDELLMNKPWTNPDDARTYFHGPDFIKYLNQQRMQLAPRQVWAWLDKLGAKHSQMNIRGKFRNYWSVPAFAQQTEDFDVPATSEIEDL